MYSCRIEYPSTHWSQEIIYRNCKLSSTPSNEEVGYAFIITRGVRSNTYPMDSAHQRYRHIHYNCLIHLKPQPLIGTPKVKAYSLQLLYSVVTTTTLYNNTDPFPACDYRHIGLVLYQFPDIRKHSILTKIGDGPAVGLLPGRGKGTFVGFLSHSDWPRRSS